MINGSFVFGLDHDGPDVFDRTVDWAVSRGVETATFHIMTPYPGTALHKRVEADGRLLHREWNLYDTRHVVYRPRLLTAGQLERGYARAYKQFYRWRNVWQSSSRQPTQRQRARHVAYAGGWKHFEPAWDMLIRSRHVSAALPMLEATLAAFGGRPSRRGSPAGVRPRPIG